MSSVEQICGLSESCREQETEKLSVYNITTSPWNGEANKHSEALSCHHLLHCGDLCWYWDICVGLMILREDICVELTLAGVGIERRYLCWVDPGWCWLKHISLVGCGLTGLRLPAEPNVSWLSAEFKYISKCELSNHSAFSQRVPCQHSRLASLLNKIHVRLSPYQDWVIHLEVPSWRWVIIISVRAD